MRKFSKKTAVIALVVAMLLTSVPSLSFADEPADPMMILRIGSDYYNAGEEYTAEVWVYNARFNVAGFSVGYDTSVVKADDDFDSAVYFDEYNSGKGLFQLATGNVDATSGKIKAVLFVSQMATSSPVVTSPTNKNAKQVEVGNEGILLAKVKFTALKDGVPGIGFGKIPDDVDFANKSYILSKNGITPEDVNLTTEYTSTPLADAESFAKNVERIGEVTLEDKDLISVSYAQYENLSELSKSLAKEAKEILDNAKAEYDRILAEMGDPEIADKFLSDLELLADTSADLEELETGLATIKAAYDALTESQKAIVDEKADVENIFAQIQAKIDEYKAQTKLADTIAALTQISEDSEITLEDAQAVKAAKDLYDSLTDNQRLQIDASLVKALEDALDAITKLEGEIYTPGDVNLDKKINALDATQILRFANNKSSVLSGVQPGDALFIAADVNSDGKINALDATQILRFANNKSSILKK